MPFWRLSFISKSYNGWLVLHVVFSLFICHVADAGVIILNTKSYRATEDGFYESPLLDDYFDTSCLFRSNL